MNLYALLAAGLLLASSVTGAFFFGRSTGLDKAAADAARLEEAVKLAVSDGVSKIKVTNQTNRQVIERETRIVPDYSQCRHSDGGLRSVNDALANRQGGVPATDAVDR